MTWGVGILGAGPGVSALHIPTLARLESDFRVVHVADGGSGRAASIGEAHGARSSSGSDALLADPAVDVVAICTPPAGHASLIRAALAAGKRTIFCEKPIATDAEDARDVLRACADADALLLVGTNHLFDPAWSRAKHYLDAAESPVSLVTVTLALAPNSRYHEVVSALPVAVPPGRGPLDLSNPELCAAVVRQLVVGLAVHDLPLVRDILPGFERLEYARAVAPIGFDLAFRSGGALVRFSAVMLPDGADRLWRLTAITPHERLEVEFPPPFVHAGSARTRLRDANGRVIDFRAVPLDGYEAEWRALAALLRGESAMEYAELLADAEDVIAIADAAAAAVLEVMSA
jgi:predicted dehydrogenase